MDCWGHQLRVRPSSILQPRHVSYLIPAVNSPYLGSAFLGCWLTDPLNHYLGRRGTLFFCGIFCTLSVIGSAVCQTWPQLLVCVPILSVPLVLRAPKVCRLLLGLGMGPKASTSPVFAAENTPANIRGGLVMCWQMWVSIKN